MGVWQCGSLTERTLVRYATQSVQGKSTSLSSRAGPGIRLFHTVELCRGSLAVYPSSAMHIYTLVHGVLDVWTSRLHCAQKCRC